MHPEQAIPETVFSPFCAATSHGGDDDVLEISHKHYRDREDILRSELTPIKGLATQCRREISRWGSMPLATISGLSYSPRTRTIAQDVRHVTIANDCCRIRVESFVNSLALIASISPM
jgi:hypothetical protein